MASFDRSVTDLQMLDRLSAGFVNLPESTYDLVLVLTDADGTRAESTKLLSRNVFARIVRALRTGGVLKTQDGNLGRAAGTELTEAILAGLVVEGDGMVKPDDSANDAVPLRLKRKDKSAAVSSAGPAVATATVSVNGKRKSVDVVQTKPAGVGFVDFSDDFDDPLLDDDEDDDDLIDEDTLLTADDLKGLVNVRMLPPSI